MEHSPQVNEISINGTLTAREAVRYTPSGLEVFEGMIHHRSKLMETNRARRLEFDCPVVSYGDTAKMLNRLDLGTEVAARGFIAPRSMKSRRLIVHITEFI